MIEDSGKPTIIITETPDAALHRVEQRARLREMQDAMSDYYHAAWEKGYLAHVDRVSDEQGYLDVVERADSRRLDWLEAHGHRYRFRAGDGEHTGKKWNIYDNAQGKGFNRDTLRDAIDAASTQRPTPTEETTNE